MIFTRAQLLDSGIPAGTLDGRVRRGELHRLLPGVFSDRDPSQLDRCRAAVAWTPGAVVSHETAASLRGWTLDDGTVHATIPPSDGRRPPKWLTLTRRVLNPLVVDDYLGVPITSRAQTLLDCCGCMPQETASRLIDEQLRAESVTREELELLACASRQRGSNLFAHLTKNAVTRYRSEPERVLAHAFQKVRYDMKLNATLGGHEVDFLDEQALLIVEVDGREFHSAKPVFRNDRRRQNEIQLNKYLVLRFAADDVMDDPIAVASQVATIGRRRRKARRRGRPRADDSNLGVSGGIPPENSSSERSAPPPPTPTLPGPETTKAGSL